MCVCVCVGVGVSVCVCVCVCVCVKGELFWQLSTSKCSCLSVALNQYTLVHNIHYQHTHTHTHARTLTHVQRVCFLTMTDQSMEILGFSRMLSSAKPAEFHSEYNRLSRVVQMADSLWPKHVTFMSSDYYPCGEPPGLISSQGPDPG